MDRMKALELLLEECKKRNLYDAYREELEGKFAELYLKNTLFSYMQGDQPKRLSFLKKIKDGMKSTFPNFQQNKYYESLADEEEKKLLGFFMKSEVFFYVYYKLLYLYRGLRSCF